RAFCRCWCRWRRRLRFWRPTRKRMPLKPIYLWTIVIVAVIVASLLSVAAYASLDGGLALVAMTYGAMALLIVTILIVQSFIVPREMAFTQPWLVSNLLSAPVALVFLVMIFYR